MPCAAVASSPIVRSLSSQPALHAQLHWLAGVAAAQTRACSELQMASAYHSACGSPGQRCARPATQHSTQRGGGQGGLSKALTRPMPLAVPPGCSVSPLSETRRGAAAHIEVQLVLVARRGVRSTHHVGCRELQCNSQSVFGEGSVANVPLDIAASHERVANSQQSRPNCVAASQDHRCCSTTPHSTIGRQWAFHRLPDETPHDTSAHPARPRLLGAIGFLLGCLLFMK